ncbi:MAG: hypothetical protein K8R40_13430 [Anaerolineaceae bacterium]|nr:hypothetical protein [Anaerolineaceae bacterium]
MSKTSIPHWDLSNVYQALDSEEFLAARDQANEMLTKMETFFKTKVTPVTAKNSPQEIEAVLSETVDQLNELQTLAFTIRAYVSSFVSTDSYNQLAMRTMSELDTPMIRMQQVGVQFIHWVGSLKEVLPEVLKISGSAKEHLFSIMETAEQSQYMMSPTEESLAAELSTSGVKAWGKLQGTVTSQLSVPFELDGEIQELPMPALINLHGHPEEDVRHRAYEAEMEAWESV